uniref:Uncharacterized protein n=1 Tax=Oryza punctata TaxID=4537 RepID=A0A0E0MKV2_ORYPU
MLRKDDVGYSAEQLPPPGVKYPMCWYWMCRNYAYNPKKPKPVPKGKKGNTKMPVKWIDKEMDEFHSGQWRQWKEEHEELKLRARQKAERERREELKLRELARQNRKKEKRAEDRASKLARVQRAKDAESEAARKGKYPPCTQ